MTESAVIFFLSYAQKVGVRYPHSKVLVRVPLVLPVSYAYGCCDYDFISSSMFSVKNMPKSCGY